VNRRRFLWAIFAAGAAGVGWPIRAAGAPANAEIVRDAILRLRVLRLRYGGFVRLVEPHALGLTAGGHPAMLAWQIEGRSRTAPPLGWRTFILSETHDVQLTVRGFARRPGYHRARSGLREIECDVSPAN
jgi:hypothetical protein